MDASVQLEINWTFSFINHFISQHIKYFCPTYINSISASVFLWPVATVNGFLQIVALGRGAAALRLFYFEAESLSYFYHSGLPAGMWRGFIKHPEISVRHDWLVGWLVWWMADWMNERMNEWINVYTGWRKLVALLLQVCQHDFTLNLDIVVLVQEVCFCSYQQTGVSVMP
jgi:hypothetical protein